MKTYYYTSQYPNYLMHFGVKGMKWGVRKYQNEDGTLTSEGEKRYGTIENLKKQRRAKKILATTLAVAVAGTATYMVGKHYWEHNAYRADEIVKSGSIIQNIAPKGRDFVSQFYGTTDKFDRQYFLKYFSDSTWRNHVSTVRADRDLKIAGMDAANEALREAMGLSVSDYKNRPGTKARDFFVRYGDNQYAVETKKKFVDNLKSKGYDGFVDFNDRSALGLNRMSKSATVFFEGSPVTIDKQSIPINLEKIKNMKVDEGDNYLRTHNNVEVVGNFLNIYGGMAALPAAMYNHHVKKSIAKSELNGDRKNRNKEYDMLNWVSKNRKNGSYKNLSYAKRKEVRAYVNDYVRKYKKEHPNTKLTDIEIGYMITQ